MPFYRIDGGGVTAAVIEVTPLPSPPQYPCPALPCPALPSLPFPPLINTPPQYPSPPLINSPALPSPPLPALPYRWHAAISPTPR
jgi:hypothetical protein